MKNKYAVQGNNEEHSAKAKANAISISTKHCIEICSYLRKKNMEKAKELLKLAIEKKKAIPFKKFTGDVGHRKGNLASGRFPVKACREILKLLETVEANAQFKGLNTSNLIISHICANKASTPWRYGRQIRRKGKRTHIEVVVKEDTKKKFKTVKKEIKPQVKKETPKPEIKKEPIKQEKPTEQKTEVKKDPVKELPKEKKHETQIPKKPEAEVKK